MGKAFRKSLEDLAEKLLRRGEGEDDEDDEDFLLKKKDDLESSFLCDREEPNMNRARVDGGAGERQWKSSHSLCLTGNVSLKKHL